MESDDPRQHVEGGVVGDDSTLITRGAVPLDRLLLDPGNELVAAADDLRDFVRAFVPRRSYQRLCAHGIVGLQSRLEKEPYTLTDRILVREERLLGDDAPCYVVIDGIWHVAALQHLAEEGPVDGGPLTDDLRRLVDNCPVLIVAPGTDPALVLALLTDPVQHHRDEWVRGQRDRLMSQLVDSGTRHERDQVLDALRHDHHALRRYHAYLGVQQMMQHRRITVEQATLIYPLFHAAVGRATLREWLDWDDHLWQFLDDANLELFHRLLTPTTVPGGGVQPPAVSSVDDIVHLCDVITEPEALAILVSEGGTLQAAIDHLNAGLFHHMTNQVSEAIGAIKWDRRRFDGRRW